MPSLTFKNVGQGDSLILEWETDKIEHIGIIDCSKKGKKNPVLEHIIGKSYRKIDFMVLSHPHQDHYSGYLEVLDYCFREGIPIDWFGHTIAQGLNKAYWKLFEYGYTSSKQFEQVMLSTIRLKKAGLLGDIESIFKSWHKELTPAIHLDALSPSHDEYELYQKKVKLEAGINKAEASQAANLLSTVIKITINGNSILVTSDAALDTFGRMHAKAGLSSTSFTLVQVPHHGSKNNHCDVFWQGLTHSDGRRAVISSGQNAKYAHPHLEVLKKIHGLDFMIHSTNIVYGMKELLNERKTTTNLDMVSDLLDKTSGDKVFAF